MDAIREKDKESLNHLNFVTARRLFIRDFLILKYHLCEERVFVFVNLVGKYVPLDGWLLQMERSFRFL